MTTLQKTLSSVKRDYITQILTDCNGNQCRAAEMLHMHRNTLGRLMRKLGLNYRKFRNKGVTA